MREINTNPAPVKLFIGMLSNDTSLFDKMQAVLEEIYGPVDIESPVWPWEHTSYYAKEMGEGLKRKFIFFKEHIGMLDVRDAKLRTVDIEKQYLNENGGRSINLDPGYLDLARIVLVSTKDFSHKIYVGRGIYAEVTLTFDRLSNSYRVMPFTFPDFRDERYHGVFKEARKLYKLQIKKGIIVPESRTPGGEYA
jgi:hypothetical protein